MHRRKSRPGRWRNRGESARDIEDRELLPLIRAEFVKYPRGCLAEWGATLAVVLTTYAEGELDAAEDDDDLAWAAQLRSTVAALRPALKKPRTRTRGTGARAGVRKPTAVAGDALGVVVPAAAWAKPRIDLIGLGLSAALDEKRPIERAVTEARAAIARGKAGTALAIGRMLWRAPGTRQVAGSVLAAAYTALGRADHAHVATVASRVATTTMLTTTPRIGRKRAAR